jgi:hypothetical protein
VRIRFCKSMNRPDPRAGKRSQGRRADLGLRMLCSLLLFLVWAIPGTSQTSDNLARVLSEFRAGDYGAAAAHFARAEEAAPGATNAGFCPCVHSPLAASLFPGQ